jgi:hypothetical protein
MCTPQHSAGRPAAIRTRRALVVAVLLAPAVLAATGCQPHSPHNPATATSSVELTSATGEAELVELPVRDEDTGAHYRRQDWGGWSRHGGCDTRETVLRRDAAPDTVHLGARCRVLAGRWDSPYDRTAITDPTQAQIDHRVPVKEANQSGARTWTHQQRVEFYNDPDNLITVSAHANTSNGDRDPATWRPANRVDWCGYAVAYIHTKHTYQLSVDPAERAALGSMLGYCRAGGDR